MGYMIKRNGPQLMMGFEDDVKNQLNTPPGCDPQAKRILTTIDTTLKIATVASVVGTGLGAYHGYRRNDSVGWAIAWGFLGGVFPFLSIPISIGQGFGKPIK